MTNNINTIRELLNFPNKNSFYFLEIIKRRKENPDMKSSAKLIRDYYIYSLEEFDKLIPNVVQHCNINNARAYFRLNVRDGIKIAHQFNKRIAELLITEDYKAIPKSYASVVGEFQHDEDKTWIVDLDGEEALPEFYSPLINFIGELSENAIKAIIPTLNGIHIITRPFRRDKFKDKYPKIDIHCDNPTILYAS